MSTSCRSNGIFFIGSVPSLISLLIILFILVTSLKQLQSDASINKFIKITYFIICISSIISVLSNLISGILCIQQFILGRIAWASYAVTLYCILATLLLRLYFTFKDSVFQVTQSQKWMIISSYLFGIICISIEIIIQPTFAFGWLVAAIIYFGQTISGMALFASKMYKLSKMDKCDEHQTDLLYTTTKYVSLLCFATFSSWIVTLCMAFVGIFIPDHDIVDILLPSMVCMDCVVNIICLYLQYPFNDKYYKRYCICITKFCMYLITKSSNDEIKLKNSIHTDDTNDDIENGEATVRID